MKNQSTMKSWLPYLTAVLGLAPGVVADLTSGAYLSGLLGLFLVGCNIYALKKLPNISLSVEVAIMLADSLAAALNAVQHMQAGTKGLHIAWWIASGAFLVAAAVFLFKKRGVGQVAESLTDANTKCPQDAS